MNVKVTLWISRFDTEFVETITVAATPGDHDQICKLVRNYYFKGGAKKFGDVEDAKVLRIEVV